MKTSLITEVFPPRMGGSGRWFWELYRRLPQEHLFIVAGDSPGHESFDRGHELDLVRYPLSFSTWGLLSPAGLSQYGRAFWRLKATLKSRGVSAVHAGKCLPEGLLAWLFKKWIGLPYICYVHGEELNLALGSRELAWWTRRVLHAAGCVVANSRNTAQLLLDIWHLQPDRLQLLYPGVDTVKFSPAPRSEETRARLGWTGRTVVLTAGRLQRRKGQDNMILALGAIREHIPDVLYAVVGDGEDRTYLESLAAEAGVSDHVQFLGECQDEKLLDCYRQCDLFALPNRQVGKDIEGFGMVLVEAQACGRAVLAGASGGTSETLLPNQTGRIVRCEEPAEIARAVIDMFSDRDRLQEMGSSARNWVIGQFDWDILVSRAQAIFKRISLGSGQATELIVKTTASTVERTAHCHETSRVS